MDDNNPLSPLWAALQSVVGWTLLAFATTFLGLWIGMAARGTVLSPDLVLGMLVMSVIAWIARPLLLVALLVTLLAWTVPMGIETRGSKLAGAVAIFVAWFSMGAWVYR